MKGYAIIHNDTGLAENAIIWDGITQYSPPDGYTLVEIPEPEEGKMTPGIGWSYVNGVWTEPVVTESNVAPGENQPNTTGSQSF